MKNTFSFKQLALACSASIIICLIIASLSGWITSHSVQSWYLSLNKPPFNPPQWIFAPVWITLYIMIGISGGILWLNRQAHKPAFYFFLIQLIFNFAWSFIFFGAHQIGLALVDILLLLTFIILTIIFAFRSNKIAAWLLVPYLLWVSFACILNIFLWKLN